MTDSESAEASRQWGDAAASWARAAEEEETGASADATTWMLEAAALRPGERVLELACGAGRVGLQAASQVGADGLVLCSDFSEAMVEAVEERVARLEMPNVRTRVLNAEELDLEGEEPFDVVLCRFGYMLMADPVKAMRESVRALRPEGRLVLAVWGEGERNPWLSLILEAVISHLNAPPPEPGTPGPFALGDPTRLREIVEAAGATVAEIAEIETRQTYDSPAAWWDQILAVSGPLATMLNALPESDRTAIREAVLNRARGFVADDGSAVFPAVVIGASCHTGG